LNWEAIGAVAELTGALGVIASLVYLAIQIRQNTASLRAENLREVVSGLAATMDRITADPKDLSLYLTGGESADSLSLEQRERFWFLVATLLASTEYIRDLHQNGLVKDGTYQAALRVLDLELSKPGVRELWNERKFSFADDFQAFVDSRLVK
jgi:hypothetical protein